MALYGKGSDPDSPCTSKIRTEVDRVATCYNALWIYHSIDFGDPPKDDSLRTSSTGTLASATSSASVSSTLISTASIAPQGPGTKRTGAIAGNDVGGVCAGALVVALGFFPSDEPRPTSVELGECTNDATNRAFT